VLDPLVALAFALHTNPGAYALLLGSGISRSAGVPTGWEVLLDLIERAAKVQGDDSGGNPEAWYREQFDEDPHYSRLLESLAREPAERQRLLRGYFEPTEDEREQGLKVPTQAHRAIARLVDGGFIRVIITTNFDRLLERALDEVGIAPTVIATADAVEGAPPLAHCQCVIVKLHGDYVDMRIRNTPSELAAYDPRVDRLLDQVFDEYGLIICGWSGEWDTALRDAISRCPTRRFTTYWATRSDLATVANDLAQVRRAEVIRIDDADAFFESIEQKVEAIRELDAPHPLSARIAVATLKRHLADPNQHIRLHDLLHDEVTRVEAQTTVEQFPVSGSIDAALYLQRLERYETICEPLCSMMAVAAFWATEEQRELLVDVLDRLGNRWNQTPGGLLPLAELLDYPATLALYAAGLGAVGASRLETLAHLLGRVEVRRLGQRVPLAVEVPVARVVEENYLQPTDGRRFYTPASDRLQRVLREPLRELIRNDESYIEAFDRFEYLFSVAYGDLMSKEGRGIWAPISSYGWRQRRRYDGNIYDAIAAEVGAAGSDWPFLKGHSSAAHRPDSSRSRRRSTRT
jgi:SIR2-like domain